MIAIVLTATACTSLPAPHIRLIDAAPINTFPPFGNVSLVSYPGERERKDHAVEAYFEDRYEILERRAYVASAFSRTLQSEMYDVLNLKLGAKLVVYKIPEGLASIRIWKRGDEYFALAESEIIYPSGNGIYGYYELRRRRAKR